MIDPEAWRFLIPGVAGLPAVAALNLVAAKASWRPSAHVTTFARAAPIACLLGVLLLVGTLLMEGGSSGPLRWLVTVVALGSLWSAWYGWSALWIGRRMGVLDARGRWVGHREVRAEVAAARAASRGR